MIPNYLYIVEGIHGYGWDFSKEEQLAAYTERVINTLHNLDSNFMFLTKSAGQNHVTLSDGTLVAVDATVWKPTGETVDFIESAGVGSANKPAWTVNATDAYPLDRMYFPANNIPVPDPPPVPDDNGGGIDQDALDSLNNYMQQVANHLNEQKALLVDCQTRLTILQKHQSEMEVNLYRKLNRSLEGGLKIPYLGNASISLTPKGD